MGYGFIPLIAAIGLGLHHVLFTDASWRSRSIVTAAVAASLLIGRYHPRWMLLATLLQVGASIYMLVYLKLRD